MAFSPILLAGMAAAGGALLLMGGKPKPATGKTKAHFVKGKSGTTWKVVHVKDVGGSAFYDIILNKTRIARYKVKGAGAPRLYLGSPPGTQQALVMRAISDFKLVAAR